jgi:hypothetical protein
MSVQARSLGSTGRPVFGRPVAAVVAALIAFAVGVPAALADEPPGPGAPAADASQTPATQPAVPPPADPPVEEPPPSDPPAVETPPADPPPADPAPADPAPAEPAPAEPAPTEPAPTGPPPAQTDTPPADGPATGHVPEQSPSEQSPEAEPDHQPPPTGGNHAAAGNESRVIQAVWQVQQGCRTYCHGTSQTQRSDQVSETNQRATAISGESNGGGSSAHARNESSTIQFVWQMQIGCVAFCFNTSQSQEASQSSYTTQEADAQSALTAWAENLAETIQYVFQAQQGCEHECHGVSQHQSSTQGQTTNQSATAEGLGGGGLFLVPDWLVAYAQNIGATIQLIYQYQEALCVEHCMGDAQLQEAIQRAVTDQIAVALAGVPEPAVPPPGEEPPGGEPPPVATDPNAVPDAAAPAAPRVAAPTSARQASVLGRQRRRAAQRQELVFRIPGTGDAPSDGGGRPAPGAPPAQVGSAPAGGSSLAAVATQDQHGTAKASVSDDGKRDARAGGDKLPAQTFAVPSGQTGGSSLGWLLVLLLTAAVAVVIASLRRGLASTMTRI